MKIRELFEVKQKNLIGVKITDSNYYNEIVIDKSMIDTPWVGDFNCSNENLNSLYGCPKHIKGDFYASSNFLTSLDGGPEIVDGYFSVTDNTQLISAKGSPKIVGGECYFINCNLTSLEGGPEKVLNDFTCTRNKINTLVGFPKEIHGTLTMSKNQLKSLQDIHKHIKRIDGTLFADDNPIESHVLGVLLIENCRYLSINNTEVQKIVNKYLPNTRGRAAMYDCQEELINAGFEEFAQL